MMRVFKGVVWTVIALAAMVLGAFAWGRLRPPTPEQRAALDLLHEDSRPTQGRNAYPMLWFANFDIPDDQLDAAYAKDRQRVIDWSASLQADAQQRSVPPPSPHADFPMLSSLSFAERKLLCTVHDPDCIGKARIHDDAWDTVIAAHAKLLARDKALADFAYVWNDMPVSPGGPMPPLNASIGLWQSAIALDFVDGKQAQALDGACTQVATMRRLHAHSNGLVVTMVLASRLRGAAHLVAQVLADMPADAPIPASCTAAFVPVTIDDVDLCPSVRSEFALLDSPQVFGRQEHWYDSSHLSRPLTERMLAPRYAAACEPALKQRLLDDEPVALTTSPPKYDVFDVIANSAGVMLSRLPTADYNKWLATQQDTVASLRMGALVLWLHDTRTNGQPLEQRLAARPAWMHFADDRQVDIAADDRGLTMTLRVDPRNEWPAVWPLSPEP